MLRRPSLLPSIIIVVSIAACAVARYQLTTALVFSSIQQASASQLGYLALKHDVTILMFALACAWIAAELKSRTHSTVLKIFAVAALVPYVVDIVVLNFFSTRLLFGEITKFSGEWDASVEFIAQAFPGGLWFPLLLGAAITFLATLFVFVRVPPPTNRARIALSLACILMFSLHLAKDAAGYVHAWTYENVYEINTRQGISLPFSDEYIQATLAREKNPLWEQTDCRPGQSKKPNIIILLFESLSMYHSTEFSGMPNICEHFDGIARSNTSYTNFYSNGFTTESALISLLTGRHLFPPVEDYKGAGWGFSFAYQGFSGREGSLPAMFADNGYVPAFITSGDLSFLDKGEWLRSLGFLHVEGDEAPFYEKWPRFHFNAAPDLALYGRTLQLLKSLEGPTPYMVMIETVSTHQPFINPLDRTHSEIAAFQYADRSLGKFYRALVQTGYFEDGILVILGDHRAMTPIHEEEMEQFGSAAAARVPMVIVWNDGRVPARIDSPAQETDFITSFRHLISDESCTGPLHGNFLSNPPVPPQFVLFPRGDDRDVVDIYTGTTQAAVRIAGDATSLLHGDLTHADALIHHIAKERLRITSEERVEEE